MPPEKRKANAPTGEPGAAAMRLHARGAVGFSKRIKDKKNFFGVTVVIWGDWKKWSKDVKGV